MSILSEFMRAFGLDQIDARTFADVNSTSNNSIGFSSNNEGTRERYAWASKSIPFYSNPVHQEANQRALSQMGAAAHDIAILNQATEYIDAYKYQGRDYTFAHAMRAPGQSVPEAAIDARNFVREKFELAWKFRALGDIERSLREFGLALHTLQDSTSPQHQNFPIWSGSKNPVTWIRHSWGEGKYPGDDSDLYKITQKAYSWYLSGQLPEGILFPIRE